MAHIPAAAQAGNGSQHRLLDEDEASAGRAGSPGSTSGHDNGWCDTSPIPGRAGFQDVVSHGDNGGRYGPPGLRLFTERRRQPP